MKVLFLEHPRQLFADRQNDIANTTLASCLNTGYLAARCIEAGYPTRIIEGYMENLSFDTIYEQIAMDPPDFLGIHLVYNWEDNSHLYRFIEKIKGEFNISHVSVYGYYPTFAYREILNNAPAIDTCMMGENEITILNLLSSLADFSEVQGIAARKGDGFIQSRGQQVQDLDSLPFPIRKPSSYPGGEVNIFGSRGCYGNCTFCYINPYYEGDHIAQGKWRGRSPENIVREIDHILATTDYRYFYFTDPNFYGPGRNGRKRVLALAELLKTRKIRFGIEARANDIDEETTAALVDAGLQNILVGLESGKDESLKRLNKHTTVSDNENALRILRRHGIEPNVGFIMFEPDSTLNDLKVNLDFLKRNDLLEHLDISVNVLYHHQIILAGSQSYQQLAELGRLRVSEHSVYEADTDYIHTEVAMFAKIMRDITNHLFDYMKDTWQDYHERKPETVAIYNEINEVLVAAFEECLQTLKAKTFHEEEGLAYVEKINQKIDSIISH
jgi:radical SAM superfamily enzyme YgiQ (UPF0313 family)